MSFSTKKNNAFSTLLSTHTSGSGTIVIQSGDQTKFPATFPFRITVYNSTLDRGTGTIFNVNSAASNTFNVTVASDESPTPVDQTFTVGSNTFIVENDWTYGSALEYETQINANTVTTTTGWSTLGATATFATANTFTTSVDLSAVLSKGDRIMLTQTTVKYFTIFAVSGTTVSITGGTDYTLVNAPITLPSYSKAASPSGYPGWFNYNANPQGFSSIPTGTYVFRTMGNTCSLKNQNMSAGTSNATTYSQTSPIPAVYNEVSTNVRIKDNGGFSTTTGAVTTTASSTTVGVFRDITGTPFTTSGGKSADFTIDFVF